MHVELVRDRVIDLVRNFRDSFQLDLRAVGCCGCGLKIPALGGTHSHSARESENAQVGTLVMAVRKRHAFAALDAGGKQQFVRKLAKRPVGPVFVRVDPDSYALDRNDNAIAGLDERNNCALLLNTGR